MNYKTINTVGTGYSGASAIYEFLQKTELFHDPFPNSQFSISYDPGGLLDLENVIINQFTINKSTLAYDKFVKLIKFYCDQNRRFKILGLIDNMSYFKGDDDKEYKIFGESGVKKTAKEFNKEFLGHLPIHQDLRNSADMGDPLTHSNPDHEVSNLFKDIAEKVKQSFL